MNGARLAHGCLVSVATTLAMGWYDREDFDVWADLLRDVLREFPATPDVLTPLRVAAEALVGAAAHDRSAALSRLRHEAQRYHRTVAADRLDQWRTQAADRVLERV
ncbi:MAG: hypothetical protein GYB53_22615 [Rhodobacteraceae bacterium]|nr:hypothetical protein [Paracoccaceae bacterium]